MNRVIPIASPGSGAIVVRWLTQDGGWKHRNCDYRRASSISSAICRQQAGNSFKRR